MCCNALPCWPVCCDWLALVPVEAVRVVGEVCVCVAVNKRLVVVLATGVKIGCSTVVTESVRVSGVGLGNSIDCGMGGSECDGMGREAAERVGMVLSE